MRSLRETLKKRGLPLACVLAVAIALLFGSRLRANSTDGRFTMVTGGYQDQVTGLTWQQPDDGNLYTWANAQTHCAKPWRLPTVEELYTLVDVRQPVAPLIDSAFTNANSYYWSSTPSASGSSNAWNVSFGNGTAGYGAVSGTYRVRCVH
jgi:hypothetical protein